MMRDHDVCDRFVLLRETTPGLCLFALVDGAQYESRTGVRLYRKASVRALFDGTEDAPLAHAGPWLMAAELIDDRQLDDLIQLERDTPAVSWLMAMQEIEGLAQLLQLRLDAKLPDGRVALIRFWDPRVLVNLAEVLDQNQRQDLFGFILEWHLLRDGNRVWIGRHDAGSQ